MLQADREEFDQYVRRYLAGCDRQPTQEKIDAYWVGLHQMALHDVVRVIDAELQREREGAMKPLAPGQFWTVLREIKAKRRAEAPRATSDAVPPRPVDKWEMTAGTHLQAHLWRLAARGRSPIAAQDRRHPMPRELSAHSMALMSPYLQAMAHWVHTMRELEADGELLEDGGKALWSDAMAQADQDSAAIRTQQEAA